LSEVLPSFNVERMIATESEARFAPYVETTNKQQREEDADLKRLVVSYQKQTQHVASSSIYIRLELWLMEILFLMLLSISE